ncbi:MAG: terminase small subunit [Ruminococcus sp.]|nr:terminase small subunit [Ruminococcus sp.]
MHGLTEKQIRFCEEYLIDLNATQSYLRAGYKAKNENVAGVEALRLLRNPKIAEYIQILREKQSERTGITSDKIIAELQKVAFADTEITEKSKIKALELLGKHMGMFTEKIKEDKSQEVVTIIDDIPID